MAQEEQSLSNPSCNDIHPTAIISPKAELGEANQIGPFAIIEDDVVMGDNNRIAGHVVLKNGTRIGDHNTMQEHTVIAGLPQDLSFSNVVTYTRIGNNNILRELVTINRSAKENEATCLGDNNYLMVNVHIGHDCQVGNHIVMGNNLLLSGHACVDDRAFISGAVGIHQFSKIGKFAMVGGLSKISKDVLPYMITDGNPGCVRGLNTVGLKRNNFSAEEIRVLKQAYKVLFRSANKLEQIIEELRAIGTEHTDYLAEFISHSKRGFHRTKRPLI